MKLSELKWVTTHVSKSSFSKANAKAVLPNGLSIETQIIYNSGSIVDYGIPSLIDSDFPIRTDNGNLIVSKHFRLSLNYNSIDFLRPVCSQHKIGLRFDDGLDSHNCEEMFKGVFTKEGLVSEVGFIELVLDFNLSKYSNTCFDSTSNGNARKVSRKNCFLLSSVDLKHLHVSLNFQTLSDSGKVNNFGRKLFDLTDEVESNKIEINGANYLGEIERVAIDLSDMSMSIEM